MFVDEKTQGEPQPVKVGTLKLSEAIRIGAMLHPQGVGLYKFAGKTCAIGAAMEALGIDGERDPSCVSKFEKALRLTSHGWPSHQVFEKNDAGISRDEIADWLESQGF